MRFYITIIGSISFTSSAGKDDNQIPLKAREYILPTICPILLFKAPDALLNISSNLRTSLSSNTRSSIVSCSNILMSLRDFEE